MPFELQPHFRGELVELRPLKEDDFDALFAVARDPLIWEQHPAWDRYKEEVFRGFFKGAMDSGGAFLILDAKSGEVIGSTRYCDYRESESQIEIGYTFLARSHWGGSSNGEMKKLMLDHALQFVDRVVFVIGPNNWRSRKAVEKIGAVFVEERISGEGQDRVIYAIDRTDLQV